MNRVVPVPRGFSPVLAGATASRVLRQLRHDPRTIAMMVVVPTVLMILLRYVLANSLPLSYAVDAMQRITATSSWTSAISADVAIILAFTVTAVVGGAFTLRRRTT